MIETLKHVLVSPFQRKGYKTFLTFTKKRILGLLATFLIIQGIVSLLIPSLFLPKKIESAWKNAKFELTTYVKTLDFSYIGIDSNDKLVTDLTPQPYLVSQKDTRETVIFGIDSTGELTDSYLNSVSSKRVTGILILTDRIVTKNSNGEMRVMRYAEYTEGRPFTLTKTQILDGLANNVVEKGIYSFITKPSTLIILFIGLLFVLIILAAISLGNILVWSAIVGLIAFLITKKSGLKRYASALKLSLLGYFAYWYILKLVSYFDFYGTLPSLIKWITIFILVSIISVTLSETKGASEEVKKD